MKWTKDECDRFGEALEKFSGFGSERACVMIARVDE